MDDHKKLQLWIGDVCLIPTASMLKDVRTLADEDAVTVRARAGARIDQREDKNASRLVVGSAHDEHGSTCPCPVRWRAGHGSLRIAVSVPGGGGCESGRFDG